jgi:hypothetical protein
MAARRLGFEIVISSSLGARFFAERPEVRIGDFVGLGRV